MTADLAITEIQNFIEHLIRTAHYVKSTEEEQGYPSSRDMLRQTWEIAFDTYGLSFWTAEEIELHWGTKDEDFYGKIFDLNVDKLKKILA